MRRTVFIITLVFLVSQSLADNRLVPSQYLTIQAAIDNCNEGDVVIVEADTYNEDISFKGVNITLKSTDVNHPENTIIQGSGTGSVVTFQGSEDANCILKGFTITDGNTPDRGGGILGNKTKATIEKCIITNNSCHKFYGGGGIYQCDGIIKDCNISDNYSEEDGGGLSRCNGEIINCIITRNSSDESYSGGGGGLYSCGGPISNCIISENSAAYGGGGMSGCGGDIINCTITNNSAEFGGGLKGCGGKIQDCKISNNVSHSGGGLRYCDALIENCEITNNNASGGYGGGLSRCDGRIVDCNISNNIASVAGGLDDCEGTIENCIIKNNIARHGGGFYSSGCTIKNCIITGNSSTYTSQGTMGGGALHSCNGLISNCVIVDNSTIAGSGTVIASCGGTIRNCIIWDNIPADAVIGWSSEPIYSCVQGGSSGEGCFDSDPCFADAQYHLSEYSACINAGDPNYDYSQDIDWDGEPRVMGAEVDVGIDEYTFAPANLVSLEITGPNEVPEHSTGFSYKAKAYYDDLSERYVTSSVLWSVEPNTYANIDSSGVLDTEVISSPQTVTIHGEYSDDSGTVQTDKIIQIYELPGILYVPDDYNTIQEAINMVDDGDTVIIKEGIYSGTGNTDLLFFGKAITVRSTDPNAPDVVAATVIDCNGIIDGASSVYRGGFIFVHNEGPNSILSGLTITRGVHYDGGGGIYCYNSEPTITNCIITGNTAHMSNGGGIYIESDISYHGGEPVILSPTIKNCVISNNQAEFGGGIYCDGADLTISNCQITGNYSQEAGGGIHCYGSSYPYQSSYLTINDSLINNNSANNGGGVYTNNSRHLKITRSQIIGNSATNNGGGVYSHYTDKKNLIINSIISSNKANQGAGFYDYQIYYFCYPAEFINCTISSNAAESIGGGVLMPNNQSTADFTGCILWGNSDTNGCDEEAQIAHDVNAVIDVSFSCIQDDNPDDINIPFGGSSNNNIDDNPMFVRDPNDGGDGWGEGGNDDYGDLHLQKDSPCMEAGWNYQVFTGDYESDIDGQPRKAGGSVDIGADEYPKTIAVTEPDGDEVWTAGSIHEIKWASYGAGNVNILFSKDGGSNWQVVASNMADTGSYLWHLPDIVNSNQCLLLVEPNPADSDAVCVESGTFEIHPDSPDPAVISRWPNLGKNLRHSGLSDFNGPIIGCEKWRFEMGGLVYASVTVGFDGRVHISCEDGKVYTLNCNGQLLWSYDTGSLLQSSPTIGPDGTVYVGAEDGGLYAIDINGRLRWKFSTEGCIYSSPAVTDDGKIFFGSADGNVYALGRDGSLLWKFETGGIGQGSGSVMSSPAIGQDGNIYVSGLYDSNMYALVPDNGDVIWACKFEFPVDPGLTKFGWPFACPVVAPDGTIYQTAVN
ncbi:MAG: right-handed parallel beta-helix repeat-containing protein, partial [Planctomycetota bacterium]